MKEVNIIVAHERLNDVNGVLRRHNVGGMYFDDITGRGRAKNEQVYELVAPDRYKTGKIYIPEFGSRTKVTVIIPDSLAKNLIDDIIGAISTGSAGDGKIFVKDISEAYDIGTKKSGEMAIV